MYVLAHFSEAHDAVANQSSKLSNASKQIEKITFIKRNSSPKPAYRFYINDDLDNVKQLRNDSTRLKKLINIIQGESEGFDKSLLDYINSNTNCALYCGNKYALTKILEQYGASFRIRYGIRAKVISEIEYKKKINKRNKA